MLLYNIILELTPNTLTSSVEPSSILSVVETVAKSSAGKLDAFSLVAVHSVYRLWLY